MTSNLYGNEGSVAPAGASIHFGLVPTAIAVGYDRSPLRGLVPSEMVNPDSFITISVSLAAEQGQIVAHSHSHGLDRSQTFKVPAGA